MSSLKRLLCLVLALCVGPVYADISSPGEPPVQPGALGNLKVKPGENGTNGDITVTNDSDSGCNVNVDPANGNANSNSTASTSGSGFSGDISGTETGDTVNIGNNAGQTSGDPAPGQGEPQDPVKVSGTGGNVSVGSGSNVKVTNTSAPGGSNIYVTTPGGGTTTVPPGSSPTFRT